MANHRRRGGPTGIPEVVDGLQLIESAAVGQPRKGERVEQERSLRANRKRVVFREDETVEHLAQTFTAHCGSAEPQRRPNCRTLGETTRCNT
jgi:hypothetical protein